MPRIRTIKPEFWASEDVWRFSHSARLLAISMWNFADDHGLGPATPQKLRLQTFPADKDVTDEDVAVWLEELTGSQVELYEDGGRMYYRVLHWYRHQRVNKPGPPLHPLPPGFTYSASAKRILQESSAKSTGTVTERSRNAPGIDSNRAENARVHGTVTERSGSVHRGKDQGTGKGKEQGACSERARVEPATPPNDPPQQPPDADAEWFAVCKAWVEEVHGGDGTGFSALRWKREAMDLSRASAGDTAALRLRIRQFLADPWVRQNRPGMGHLAKHWEKYDPSHSPEPALDADARAGLEADRKRLAFELRGNEDMLAACPPSEHAALKAECSRLRAEIGEIGKQLGGEKT